MIWKLVAVAFYAVVLLGIGVVASRRTKNIRDYFAGGKNLGFINVAFSARATGESAWLLLGLTGAGFMFGARGFWVVLGEVIGVGGAWLLMARRFKRLSDQYDSVTVPDYLESRFRDSGHKLRLIAAFTLMVFVPIYAGAQVFATGQAFNSFFGWNHFYGAIAGFLVVMLYITKGGFIAVVWSDVFQGSLMVLGLVGLPIVALMELGGVTNLTENLRAIDPDLLSLHGPGPIPAGQTMPVPGSGGWSVLSVTTVLGLAAIGIGFWGSPQVFVRYISLRSEKEINKGAAVAIVWTILADGGAVLVGMVGRAMFGLEDLGMNPDTLLPINAGPDAAPEGTMSALRENILPHMATELLPAFFAGVFIAMVLSAIMSTVDSLLVVASSAGVRDYWQKTKHPDMDDKTLINLSHRVTLVLALVALAVGLGLLWHDRSKPLFWIVIFGWSGIAATFCPTMILSLFWSKFTARGAIGAMVVGFLMVPFFSFGAGPLLNAVGWSDGADYLGALDVLLPAFIVSGVAGIVLSLTDGGGQERVMDAKADLQKAASRGE